MSPAAARANDLQPRRRVFVVLAVALAIACLGCVALGVWQLQRMQWKRDLIERVEARVGAAPVAIPQRTRWPDVDAASDEYRRVQATGMYLPGAEARTQAVTDLGAGFWVLTALRTDAGEVVFVNRGFVPTGVQPSPAPSGQVTVTGLLRLPEPGGGFLRRNDAPADRWYSRDVHAIAGARGLPVASVAPFFIDAEAGNASAAWPRAGMTVVRFRDTHLSYALTWFALAALTAWAGLRLWRIDRRDAAAGCEEDA